MKIEKTRDLTLAHIGEEKVLVTACDSCGSVGIKDMDVLKVPPYFTGRYTARVGMMEVLCAGAEIITITNTVCCEMNPTGEEIIKGIKDELIDAGISEVVLTGSTEENFTTYSTALGITVIGIAESNKLRVNNISEDCAVISIGLPKVGGEINVNKDRDLFDYNQLKTLIKNPFVYEIVPGGSKGLKYEAKSLADGNGFLFKQSENISIDIRKSCGPATAAIAAVKLDQAFKIINELANCELIGYLYKE